MDIINAVTKFTDHNRWTVTLPAIGLLMLIPGCLDAYDRKATSPVSGEQVSLNDLEREVLRKQGSLQSQYNEVTTQIKALDSQREQIVAESVSLSEQTAGAIEQIEEEGNNLNGLLGGTIDFVTSTFPASAPYLLPIGGLIGTLFGAGVTVDNRRKDRLIKSLKPSSPDNPANAG